MAPPPGGGMPRASASAFIVEAVPMVLQWPIDGAEAAAISRNSRLSMRPAVSDSPAFHTTVPEPALSPFHQPFNIGPPDRTIAGIFTVAAAMRQAGVVLSQPVISTTPSSG